MQKALTLLGLALFAFPAFAQTDTGSAEHVGTIFCENRGNPDIGPRAPYLSADLKAAIAAAQAANRHFVDTYPDEKPPLGDGIPWQSAPDYAEACTAGEPHYMMDEARLAVRYAFPRFPDADYEDRLWLILVDGHWLIDDISYASGGLSLRDILARIAEGASE